jgi:hypothetical protein
MIAFIITQYLEKNNKTLKALCERMGFHYKIVWNWAKGHNIPNEFSADCLVTTLLESVDQEKKHGYQEHFWEMWRLDKQFRRKNAQRLRS